jgi:hypothetical protein
MDTSTAKGVTSIDMAIFFAVILDLIGEVILFDKNSDKFLRGTFNY